MAKELTTRTCPHCGKETDARSPLCHHCLEITILDPEARVSFKKECAERIELIESRIAKLQEDKGRLRSGQPMYYVGGTLIIIAAIWTIVLILLGDYISTIMPFLVGVLGGGIASAGVSYEDDRKKYGREFDEQIAELIRKKAQIVAALVKQ
jgi:hypothetical protein